MKEIIKSKSDINYSYATIRMTQSRIDKGLIAIPASLEKWFPDHTDTIYVYLDDSPILRTPKYTPRTSNTRECRIYTMKEWFGKNKIKDGDEIVIQVIDREKRIYRLTSEKKFIAKTQMLQNNLDKAETEEEASEKIITLARWTNLDRYKIIVNEYHRLVNVMPVKERQSVNKQSSRTREKVPANMKTLLEGIYKGHCQVCDFWFLKIDNKPYFEIHHLDPLKDHHPKNLVVVCGNCHNQFEYANVNKEFNEHNWLIKVSFNNKLYPVKQAILTMPTKEIFKEIYI